MGVVNISSVNARDVRIMIAFGNTVIDRKLSEFKLSTQRDVLPTYSTIQSLAKGGPPDHFFPGKRSISFSMTTSDNIDGFVKSLRQDPSAENHMDLKVTDADGVTAEYKLNQFHLTSCQTSLDSNGTQTTELWGVLNGFQAGIGAIKTPKHAEKKEFVNPPLPDGIFVANLPPVKKAKSNGL